jgi:PAS domain S-box-containing protein
MLWPVITIIAAGLLLVNGLLAYRFRTRLRAAGAHTTQQLLDTLPAGVYVCDAAGLIESCNRRAIEIWGRAPNIGDSAERFCGSFRMYTADGTYLPHADSPMAEVLRTETAIADQEIVIERPDGLRRTLIVNVAPRRDTQGGLTGGINCLTDITGRKDAESALRKSERVLREAEELGRTGSWERNLVTDEVFNSEQNKRLHFGDDRSRGGRFDDYLEAMHPDDRWILTGRRERLKTERNPPDIEFRVVWPDGSVHWLLGRATGMHDEAGNPVRVHGTNVDITERKRAEGELRQNQQLLNLVLATLPVGVSVLDKNGDTILVNAATTQIWGGKNIVSGRERWQQSKGAWHDTGKAIAPGDWASVRALSRGETSLNELIDIETYDGGHKTIQNSSAPVRDIEGNIVGAMIVNEDVTERVRANEALRESGNRLQQLSRRLLQVQEEERRHLARELHDEFGQLLTGISLHLRAAREAVGEGTYASLEQCMTLLERGGAQVRGLALELRPVMLETAGLDATLRWFADQHRQRTGVAAEITGSVGEVAGDLAIACFRIVQEALTNVARHARAKHVRVALNHSETAIGLVITDDGAGFDVGATLANAGTGDHLGLLGMRERVEILGGTLEVKSQPGKGTQISVSFPLDGIRRKELQQTPSD